MSQEGGDTPQGERLVIGAGQTASLPIRFDVCLRIHPGETDCNVISHSLGVDSTRAVSLEPADGPITRTQFYLGSRNAWLLSSEDVVGARDPATHLAWFLGLLGPLAPKVRKLAGELGFSASIEISLWTKDGVGVELTADQCRTLATFGLPVRVSFVCFGDGEAVRGPDRWPVRADDFCRFNIALLVYPGGSHFNLVSEKLAIDATQAVAVEVVQEPLRAKKARLGRLNGWFIHSEQHVESLEPRAHLEWFGRTLSSKAAQLGEILGAQDARAHINVTIWSNSVAADLCLEPDDLESLAALGVRVCFQFAGYGD